VTYEKSGERVVKWYASNDTLFCSARGYELRGKYENQWGYTCATLPNRDGIDLLSPTQRLILDQRLKALQEQGAGSVPELTITGVRAVASTPLDKTPSKIALQYWHHVSRARSR
jgi:hypothetical protein